MDELVTCLRCGFSYPLRELLMLRRTYCRNCGAELDLVKSLPSAQPDDLISKLSEIRSEYNCFDEDEEPYYRALSDVIKILSRLEDGDAISRQQAIDEFNCCELTPDGGIDANHAIDVLKQLPSAQPEIVRCKDCNHYQFADNRAFGMPVKMCTWFGFEDVDDNDFCSRAERWEE